MVDTMNVLGAAACAKLTADRLVRDFVAYVRETRVTNPEPTPKPSRRRRNRNRLSRPLKASTSGLGPRPSSSRVSKKVSRMTDAELEAELENRRRRRAKERDLYSRAMRSEKLAALEAELANLRREIGRVDTVPSKSVSRSGTPHSVRWEPLPNTRRSIDMRSPILPGTNAVSAPATPARSPPSSGPPPPPPPPPPPGANEDEAFTIDPEQRRREKEERQMRREAKKKEREQAQKKLTLADIIRSAGPNPMNRLKPAGKRPADAEKEEFQKQKQEREEREMRQEQERIDQEKKTMENMGRRVTEQEPTKTDKSDYEDEAKDPQTDSKSETTPVKGAKANGVKGSPTSEKEPSRPLDRTPPESRDAFSKAEDDESHSHENIDSAHAGEVKDVTDGKKSESSADQLTRRVEPLTDSTLSSAVSELQTCKLNGDEKNPTASERLVTGEEGKKDEEAYKVKTGSELTQADVENISPNASATKTAPGEKPERKVVELDESIDHPTIL